MLFKVVNLFNRQRELSKYLFLHVNSFDFHLIRLPYAYTWSATPWRLTSINILGPLFPWARFTSAPKRGPGLVHPKGSRGVMQRQYTAMPADQETHP